MATTDDLVTDLEKLVAPVGEFDAPASEFDVRDIDDAANQPRRQSIRSADAAAASPDAQAGPS